MTLIPGKQVAALEPLTEQLTTDLIITGSSIATERETQLIATLTGTNTERMFLRNVRLSRTASQYNSGQYGTYNGSNGYSIRVELWAWVSDQYDYTTATADNDGPNLLAWRQADTSSYDASTQSLIVDFPLAQWFGPTFPDVALSPFKFALVIVDDSAITTTGDTTRYDVSLQYDKARSL